MKAVSRCVDEVSDGISTVERKGFDARRLDKLLSDERRAVLLDCQDMRRDTDVGALNGRWLTFYRWYARSLELQRFFDANMVRYKMKEEYVL